MGITETSCPNVFAIGDVIAVRCSPTRPLKKVLFVWKISKAFTLT